MNPVYPTQFVIEFYSTGTYTSLGFPVSGWKDLTGDVVSTIKGYNGFESNDPADRVAYTGLLEFQLDNSEKAYSPMGGDVTRNLNTLLGWRKGVRIRIREQFAGDDDVIWAGFVLDIQTDPGNKGTQRASVVCGDWIDIASRYPMRKTDIVTDTTIDAAMHAIANRTALQPDGRDFDTGDNTFTAVFDSVKPKTKSIAEISKLALSELGYVYVLKDGSLRVENSRARPGTRALDAVNIPLDYSAALLWDGTGTMNGNVALQENGQVILVDEYRAPRLATSMLDMAIGMEKNFVNTGYVRAFPTRIDTSLKDVFVLNKAIKLGSGDSIRFQGTYANPDGGGQINAINLQTPVASTDYQMWSGLSGTSYGIGSDLTANLNVSATYYGDVVDYLLINVGATSGYVTLLKARGFGVYRESTLYGEVIDDTTIALDGEATADIEQKYKNDTYAALAYMKSFVEQYKMPKTRVFSVKYSANQSIDHMLAFTKLDVGSLIEVTEERSGLSNYYYILKRVFEIAHGGIITFTFLLSQVISISSGGLNPVAVEFTPGSGDAVNFGYLPHLINQRKRTFSLWMYQEDQATQDAMILSLHSDATGPLLYVDGHPSNRILAFYSNSYANDGKWTAPVNAHNTGTWNHIAVTYDESSSNNDPIMYINTDKQTLTEEQIPSGVLNDETTEHLVIGNWYTATQAYTRPFTGKIQDVRIYNRLLSQQEINAIYNNGHASMSAGAQDMEFHAFAINSDLGTSSDLDGDEIPTGNNFFDNVYQYIGEPNGSPVIRTHGS